jgi:hypothetical protein
MNDADWRSRVCWVVVHPDRPEVLALEQEGGLALPETELATKVWTADAAAMLPAVAELVGFDVVLLCCVDEHEDEAARVLRATLMAAPVRRHRPVRVPGGSGARTSPARCSSTTSRPWWPGSSTSWPEGRPAP